MKTTTWIPNPIRRDLSIRSKGLCEMCKEKAKSFKQDRWGILRFYDQDAKSFEVDHILPIYKGGKTDMGNLRLVCRKCNRSRKRKTEEYEQVTNEIIKSFTKQQ